jgi:phosphohistidine phosphatase
MKTLLILRHAKSRPKGPNLSDHDRPLDELGKDDALLMGKLISRDKKDLVPDFIISSNALRAKTTAELVAKGCKYERDIVLYHSLYEAKPKDYMNILETLSDRHTRVLLVGHNPTIEEAIEMLTDSKLTSAATGQPIEYWIVTTTEIRYSMAVSKISRLLMMAFFDFDFDFTNEIFALFMLFSPIFI